MKNIKIIILAALLIIVASSYAQQNAGSVDKNQAKASTGQVDQSVRPVSDPPVSHAGNGNNLTILGSTADKAQEMNEVTPSDPNAPSAAHRSGSEMSGPDQAEPASKSISEYSGPTVASPSQDSKPDLK
jgi:hypothetical protein